MMENAQTLLHAASGTCGNNGKKCSKRPIAFQRGCGDEEDEIPAEVPHDPGRSLPLIVGPTKAATRLPATCLPRQLVEYVDSDQDR
jgi:hypothetical protein